MRLHSEIPRPSRARTRGGFLVEALIGMSLLSALVVAGIVGLVHSAKTESERRERAWLAEFARSKAEEYVTTYPLVKGEGDEPGRWNWRIEEKRVLPDGESPFDKDITLYELSVNVWNGNSPDRVYSVRTIMARRP